MRKITEEKTLYTFKELSETSKEAVLNSFRADREFFNDYIIEDFLTAVKEKTDIDLNEKSISWAVGDRNSHFSINQNDLEKAFLNKYEPKIWDITAKAGAGLNHLGGGICRQTATEENRASIEFEDDETTETERETLKAEINEKLNIIIDLCRETHKKNEEAYNYSISDEAIIEDIEANEYEFEADGGLY